MDPVASATVFGQPNRRTKNLLSTSLIYAEKTLAFISALPAARRTLLGCQSTERTVDLIGFLRRRETHQLLSSSNEQTAIALFVDSIHICELSSEAQKQNWPPSAGGNGKFILVRTPPYKCRRTIDPQQHKCRLPLPLSLRESPDISIPILRTCNDAVGVWSPIDRGNELVVLVEGCDGDRWGGRGRWEIENLGCGGVEGDCYFCE